MLSQWEKLECQFWQNLKAFNYFFSGVGRKFLLFIINLPSWSALTMKSDTSTDSNVTCTMHKEEDSKLLWVQRRSVKFNRNLWRTFPDKQLFSGNRFSIAVFLTVFHWIQVFKKLIFNLSKSLKPNDKLHPSSYTREDFSNFQRSHQNLHADLVAKDRTGTARCLGHQKIWDFFK